MLRTKSVDLAVSESQLVKHLAAKSGVVGAVVTFFSLLAQNFNFFFLSFSFHGGICQLHRKVIVELW